ncbi:hypothetical protein HDU90_004191 [Geranomyces variabilis]|nr:hypothetical protein HDU90_004191 [Geranomyces variabilis]
MAAALTLLNDDVLLVLAQQLSGEALLRLSQTHTRFHKLLPDWPTWIDQKLAREGWPNETTMLRELDALDAVKKDCDRMDEVKKYGDRIGNALAQRFRKRLNTVLSTKGSLGNYTKVARADLPLHANGPHIPVHFWAREHECLVLPVFDERGTEEVLWMEIPSPAFCAVLSGIPEGSKRVLLCRDATAKIAGEFKSLVTMARGGLLSLAEHLTRMHYLGSTEWTAEVLAAAFEIHEEEEEDEDLDTDVDEDSVPVFSKEKLEIPQFAPTAENVRPICMALTSRVSRNRNHPHPADAIFKAVSDHFINALSTWPMIVARTVQLNEDRHHIVHARDVAALEVRLSRFTIQEQKGLFATGMEHKEQEEQFHAVFLVKPANNDILPLTFHINGRTATVGGDLKRSFRFEVTLYNDLAGAYALSATAPSFIPRASECAAGNELVDFDLVLPSNHPLANEVETRLSHSEEAAGTILAVTSPFLMTTLKDWRSYTTLLKNSNDPSPNDWKVTFGAPLVIPGSNPALDKVTVTIYPRGHVFDAQHSTSVYMHTLSAFRRSKRSSWILVGQGFSDDG